MRRSLLGAADFDGIRRMGHNMKGSGMGYGLPEMTRIGEALERAARRGDAEALRQSIADMVVYLSHLSIRSADGRVLVEP